MKKVIVIVGPTASGKTSYSIKLAKKFNAEIINGDSVQVYKDLNIGSAKITKEQQDGVKHHLLNILKPNEAFSAFDFQKLARAKIHKINLPIIVGGTGFYIKSALYNYKFNDEVNKNDDNLDNLSKETLYNELVRLDPKIKIDKNNKRRLIRALRLAKSGDLRSEKKGKNEPLYDILTIYLDIDRTVLNERLHKRLDLMLEQGFIEEVKSLRSKGIELNIIGYREINSYLAGNLTLEEAKFKTIVASRRLAKRQKTWFKNQMDANNFDPLNSNSLKAMEKLISNFLGE